MAGGSQKSQCEKEVAVVAVVGLRLPPDTVPEPPAWGSARSPWEHTAQRHLVGVPGKSDHPDTRAALPQTWRKLWQAHSVQGWGAWGRSGKAGSSEGPAPIISRHQACCLSGGLRSRGCRPCSDTHSVTTLAISGRQASSKDSLSPLHLGHDSRKLDRRPPGLSSSCFQGDA